MNKYIGKQTYSDLKFSDSKVVGYMSGTFDLFHIGHLNILKRAAAKCDELIVGVHESGAWKGKETFIPFEERKAIVGSIRYVSKAVKSFSEDIHAHEEFSINKLFVGDDYKNSDRFFDYEIYCKQHNIEIYYFPYTKSTSSSQLRAGLQALMPS